MDDKNKMHLWERFGNNPEAVMLLIVFEHRITGKRQENKMPVPYLTTDMLMTIVQNMNESYEQGGNLKLKCILHGTTGELLYEPIFDKD